MIDPFVLAQLDRSKVLRIFPLRAERTTCVLCGADIFRDEWAVTIKGHGRAHPPCADDRGWEVR